jgi:1-acyl-sn-glycerol-3-phosphate acyltransferase
MGPGSRHRYLQGYEQRASLSARLSVPQAPMGVGQRLWFRFSWLVLAVFFKGLNHLKISGSEHVPAGGGVLFAANHLSIFDTLLIPWVNIAAVSLEVVWAPAKAELFDLPVVNHLITSWGAFPVHRGGGDMRAMRRLLDLMRREKVMLFPEGTRSIDGKLGPANRAVGKLIYIARPIVIPTALVGTDRLLAKGRRVPRLFTDLEVRFGQPLDLQRYYRAENTKATAQAIAHTVMRSIARLRGEEDTWLATFPA